MSIGTLLKQKRTERGWSLRQAQEASGVTYQQIKNIEDGTHSPTFTTLSKLLHALDVEPNELIDVLEPAS